MVRDFLLLALISVFMRNVLSRRNNGKMGCGMVGGSTCCSMSNEHNFETLILKCTMDFNTQVCHANKTNRHEMKLLIEIYSKLSTAEVSD